jgi:hypothetical protein
MALTFVNATNPQFADAANRTIRLAVKFAEFTEAITYLATPDDTEPHGAWIYQQAAMGQFGVPAPYSISPAQQLINLKASLCKQIDKIAEGIRITYITDGSGQSMVYQEKYSEALDIQNDPNPQPANYPICAASLGVEGQTLQTIAALVLATRTKWLTVAAAIENARLGGKGLVNAAATLDAANAAFTSINWPLQFSG